MFLEEETLKLLSNVGPVDRINLMASEQSCRRYYEQYS